MPAPPTSAHPNPRRALALLAVCGGAFLPFLDTTIVNTSFPDIRRDFSGASTHELVWILDAYFIAIAAMLVPAGGVADWFGRRRVFIAGTAAFVVTSLLCAAAPSWELLTAARIAQGIASAIMGPASLALLLQLFPPERRAAGVGIWGAAAALAAATGPPLGGVLVEIADWRWIFLVNLPLGVILIWAAQRGLQESRDETATGLPDLFGSLLIAIGLGLLALGLIRGEDWGWVSAPTAGSFVLALLALAAATRRSSTHPRPAFDLTLLEIPSFRQGTVGTALFATAFFSMILANILFLTSVWDYSVLMAGLAVAPGPLASTVAAGPAGRAADRFGHRAVIIPGTVLYAAGILILRAAGPDPAYLSDWLPGQLVIGIGIGLAFPTLGAAAAADIPDRQFATAAAATAAARQVGAVLGTALLVAILGTPQAPAEAMAAFDDVYWLGVIASLLSGAAVVRLVPARRGAQLDGPADAAALAALAGGDRPSTTERASTAARTAPAEAKP